MCAAHDALASVFAEQINFAHGALHEMKLEALFGMRHQRPMLLLTFQWERIKG